MNVDNGIQRVCESFKHKNCRTDMMTPKAEVEVTSRGRLHGLLDSLPDKFMHVNAPMMSLSKSLQTSLKLSKAERMMSWPPRTKHTAASSSSTRALVLRGVIEGTVILLL